MKVIKLTESQLVKIVEQLVNEKLEVTTNQVTAPKFVGDKIVMYDEEAGKDVVVATIDKATKIIQPLKRYKSPHYIGKIISRVAKEKGYDVYNK